MEFIGGEEKQEKNKQRTNCGPLLETIRPRAEVSDAGLRSLDAKEKPEFGT